MGVVDTLIGDAFGEVFGGGLIMGAFLFIVIAYIAFRSGLNTSALVFIGMLSLGVFTALGYIDFIVYGIVLIAGAFFFWRTTMAVGG